MAINILAINGSYRVDGSTDRIVEALTSELIKRGAEVEQIFLRDHEINFCLNCRECMQNPGTDPQSCVQADMMKDIVQKLENADAYILATPTNLGTVTAIFKRFMERLAVYEYWPWSAAAPKHRKNNTPRKKAILITSTSAPAFIARWVFSTIGQLKYTAKIIGADTAGIIFTGLVSGKTHEKISEKSKKKAIQIANKLI